MAKIIQRVQIKRTKNELRAEEELKAIEARLNADPIIMDFGKFAPIKWLSELYKHKAAKRGLSPERWTESRIRTHLFHNYTKGDPLTLFSIKYVSASAFVLEEEARKILDDLIEREVKRGERKERVIKVKSIKQQRKQSQSI